MRITFNDHSYTLKKSTLDTETIRHTMEYWREKEACLSLFESDEICIICLQKNPTTKSRFCHNDYDKGRLLYAHQYLLDHLTLSPSTDELAKIAGINSFKLKNGFRELFGDSIFGYLNRYRLEKGRQMIVQGEKNMTQIAFDLGFSSLQHFSAAFKREYGCSPKKIKTVEGQVSKT